MRFSPVMMTATLAALGLAPFLLPQVWDQKFSVRVQLWLLPG